MFVAFSAWLLRVLCVYTLSLATSVPVREMLTKSPLSAIMSIFGDILSISNLHMSWNVPSTIYPKGDPFEATVARLCE